MVTTLLMWSSAPFLVLIPLAFNAMIAPMIAPITVVIAAIDLIESLTILMIFPILGAASLSARMSTQKKKRAPVQNDLIVANHYLVH